MAARRLVCAGGETIEHLVYQQMPHRKDIKGVLHNFLGTYTSRYADFDGFWLWGLLVKDLTELQIDLLQPTDPVAATAPTFAISLAASKFSEQIEKAGFDFLLIRKASLVITKSTSPRNDLPNGQSGPARTGYDIRFAITVEFNDGKAFKNEISIFVAPHDPKVEARSARGA